MTTNHTEEHLLATAASDKARESYQRGLRADLSYRDAQLAIRHELDAIRAELELHAERFRAEGSRNYGYVGDLLAALHNLRETHALGSDATAEEDEDGTVTAWSHALGRMVTIPGDENPE